VRVKVAGTIACAVEANAPKPVMGAVRKTPTWIAADNTPEPVRVTVSWAVWLAVTVSVPEPESSPGSLSSAHHPVIGVGVVSVVHQPGEATARPLSAIVAVWPVRAA
jgi:hypothetical protein